MPILQGEFTKAIFNRFLEERIQRAAVKKYQATPFADGRYLPQMPGLNPGANKVIEELITHVASGEIIKGNTDAIETSEAVIEEDDYKVVIIASAFSYAHFEIQADTLSRQNGMVSPSISTLRMESAIKGIRDRSHFIGAYGDDAHGLTGVLNNPAVPVVTLSANPNTATSEQLYDLIVREVALPVQQQTKQVGRPNVMLVDETLNSSLLDLRSSSAADSTVKKLVLNNLGEEEYGLESISRSNELSETELQARGIVAADTGRIANLSIRQDSYYRKISSLTIMPPEQKGLGYKVCMYQAFSDVIWTNPLESNYADYPTT